jgi:uncharacterized protein YxjI
MDDKFSRSTYVIRKDFKIIGRAFHIYDADENRLFYTELKSKRMNEEISLCTDEGMDILMLSIKPRNTPNSALVFDVVDPSDHKILGVLQRKGFESLFKDKWMLMPTGERYHGFIEEVNLPLALIRRTIGMGPQTFKATLEGHLLCTFQQNINPFVRKLTIDFSADTARRFDHRIGIAAGILLAALEGTKDSQL